MKILPTIWRGESTPLYVKFKYNVLEKRGADEGIVVTNESLGEQNEQQYTYSCPETTQHKQKCGKGYHESLFLRYIVMSQEGIQENVIAAAADTLVSANDQLLLAAIIYR